MFSRKSFFIILVLAIIFGTFVGIGYFKRKRTLTKPGIKPETSIPTTTPLVSTNTETTTLTLPTSSEIERKTVEPFLTDKYLYLQLTFPQIYVYNLNQNVFQGINLETKESQDIYKVDNLTKAKLSDDQKSLLFYTDQAKKWYLLNISQDKLLKLPPSVEDAFFIGKIPVLFIKDKTPFLAFFKNNKVSKIINLNFEKPEFVILDPKKILIFEKEKESKVFLLDLTQINKTKQPPKLEVFLENQDHYSILSNKDLIFVSSLKGSQIINLKKEVMKEFDWKAKAENCSFEKYLICGLENNKIVIYDLENQEEKEIDLEESYDVRFPHLTSLGLIFLNGLDGQFYIIKPENISL